MICPFSENTVLPEKVQSRTPGMIKVVELFSPRKLKLFSIGRDD